MTARQTVTVDLLSTDLYGGQRSVTRFSVIPGHEGNWMGAASRHWVLDGDAPR